MTEIVYTGRKRNNNKVAQKFDKQLINVTQTTVGNLQINTVLITLNFPCVVMGIIVTGGSIGLTTAAEYQWVMVMVPEGTTPSPMGFNSSTYQPEQMVFCFGAGFVSSQSGSTHTCKLKTGRKMRSGDRVYFCLRQLTPAISILHNYTIQFFLKI